ncbi:IS21 family transposase [Candidatus Chloroploca asiatica]|uniref:Integrase n=1 Tax=Candidatus Chloroploca asiatica TaxID=1506545 RepID=A0A2H3KNZ4_9CHLR|nr:IS21 family transposase [Candidatus Chloroploca asiatica]PDV96866.1 integrase [Candidatus Chloroploca asiatica]
MKTDHEVRQMRRERSKGKTQEQAAARAGMSVRTARKYEQLGQLPSQTKQPRTHRTRPNPFEADWPWVVAQLERDPALQAKTLFAELARMHPGRYTPTQLRTLQRHIAHWRAQFGPSREVMFPQEHQPGRMGQSDFTEMNDLQITLAGVPFLHLLYHFVLTYSNIEAVAICFSESFEALAEGLEACLWQVGGVPQQHRTDNLSAAVVTIAAAGERVYTERYLALVRHYRMQPSTNTPGEAHENGDVEQAHYRFKEAVDQALRLRGSRDFADRPAYTRWLHELVRHRNLTRAARFAEERPVLQPLPTLPLEPAQDLTVTVSRFATINVLRNIYSVPARLIGKTLLARVRAERVDLYLGMTLLLQMPRLRGVSQHRIDYRHVIDSLVRKPGAFAQYRYRDELFPSVVFRQAYDHLSAQQPQRADQQYVRVLHLAATTSEREVETALALLWEAGTVPTHAAVRDLVSDRTPTPFPVLSPPVLALASYDQLLGPQEQEAA